jgi:hypothetical protein
MKYLAALALITLSLLPACAAVKPLVTASRTCDTISLTELEHVLDDYSAALKPATNMLDAATALQKVGEKDGFDALICVIVAAASAAPPTQSAPMDHSRGTEL